MINSIYVHKEVDYVKFNFGGGLPTPLLKKTLRITKSITTANRGLVQYPFYRL
ncbi:hypothetical protein LZZ90_13785 [Flavobacterium sp. SM15]|uniref:hypothetical protein n=1 Tax=Flavobacterium sp. SM15 TaxID=2908005 RepID=UPI001EDBFB06|nr:hypothetical protein [Flavobacterium sp. SM15]MCG2612012.1 hypothetical protein [Flavobacterium sp. SM15]MCG2612581.1 hypothetical protein [Flavobacterium sp. SM15]